MIESLRYRERLWPLIVAPASIQEVWVAEIQKWFTGIPGRPRRLEVYRVDEPSLKHAAALKRPEVMLERISELEITTFGSAVDARARERELEEDERALDELRLQTVLTWRARKDGPLLISYEQLRRSAGAPREARAQTEMGGLLLTVPNLVICDEGHMNRNPGTQTYRALERLKTRRRLMLTGRFLMNISKVGHRLE